MTLVFKFWLLTSFFWIASLQVIKEKFFKNWLNIVTSILNLNQYWIQKSSSLYWCNRLPPIKTKHIDNVNRLNFTCKTICRNLRIFSLFKSGWIWAKQYLVHNYSWLNFINKVHSFTAHLGVVKLETINSMRSENILDFTSLLGQYPWFRFFFLSWIIWRLMLEWVYTVQLYSVHLKVGKLQTYCTSSITCEKGGGAKFCRF